MGKIKDLTGETFGKLKVIEITPERRNRQVVWKCQCECGNIVNVVGQALRTGHTKSCGCLNYEKKDLDSLKGQTFGKLTVIKRSLYNYNNKVYWDCICECGGECMVLGTHLRNGSVIECEICRKNNPNYNYKFNDLTNLKFGLLTVISHEGKDAGGHYTWKCMCDCGGKTIVSSNALLSGNTSSCGCLKNTSIGEAKINSFLLEKNRIFKRQITFNNCLSPKGSKLLYDFGIYHNEQLLGLIEYDGIQHFQPIEYFGGKDGFSYLHECDKIKDKYAKENNISLLRISYLDQNKINEILNQWLGEIDNACL